MLLPFKEHDPHMHSSLWTPASVDVYNPKEFDIASIEEFIVDPVAIIHAWFDNYVHVGSAKTKPVLGPLESSSYGFVHHKSKDVVMPVSFQAVMPASLLKLANEVIGRPTYGRIHSWTHNEVKLETAKRHLA